MRVGVAYVDVRVNMTQYKTDLNKLVNDASTAATKVNAQLSKIGVGQTRLGQSSTAAASGMNRVTSASKRQGKSLMGLVPHVLAVTGAYMAMRAAWRGVLSAVGAGVAFEKKMSAVKAISRATEKDFAALGTAARKLAADTVFTANETADALRYLAMAGFDAKESIAALPGVLNLALIGELELGRATDIATDTLRAFGLQAHDIGRVTDVMVSIITRSNTNIEMMGQAMKFAAPLARALGYEIEEVSAMIGVLATAGIKAGIAGRGLQQSFIRTQKAAAKLGLDIGTGLINVLKAYRKEQERLTEVYNEVIAREKIALLIKKDYGLIAAKTVFILKDNIEAFEELALSAHLSAMETEEAAMIMQDNVDSAFKRLKSIIAEISISVFSNYKGGLKGFLEETTLWFKQNKDEIVVWADILIKSFKVVTGTIGLVATSVKKLWDLFPDWAKAALKMANPFKHLLALFDRLEIMKSGGVLPTPRKIYTVGEDREMSLDAQGVMQGGAASTPDLLRSINEYTDAMGRAATAQRGANVEAEKANTLAAIRAKSNLIDELVMEGFAWEGFASDAEMASDVLRRKYKEAIDALPPSLRKVYDEHHKILELRAKTMEQLKSIAEVEPEVAKKIADMVVATYKKQIKGKAKLQKAELREHEKAARSLSKFEQKTQIMSEKAAGDKYDGMVTKANQFLHEQMVIYNKDAAASEAAGATKERIYGAYNKRIKAIDDARFKERSKKDIKEDAAAAKARLDLQKELLSEMNLNDKRYFDLLKEIRIAEKAIMKEKYKGTDMEGVIDDIFVEKAKDDYVTLLLSHDDMIDGMKAGWLDWVENAKTAAQIGKEVFDEFADSATSALSSTFYEFAKGTKSFSDIWYDFLDSMLKAFSDAMAEMLMKWVMKDMVNEMTGAIGGLAKMLFGAGISTGTSAASFPSQSTTTTFYAHRGGIVGTTPMPVRLVNSSIFKNAPRLHGGLKPDEFPTILQKGETVFPKGENVFKRTSAPDLSMRSDTPQPAPIKNTYNVNISAVDSRSFVDLMNKNPGAVLLSVNKALERNPSGRHSMKRMVS